jgi:hypothetical protein
MTLTALPQYWCICQVGTCLTMLHGPRTDCRHLAEAKRCILVVLLADIQEGGETAFSKSEWLNETAQRAAVPSECAHAKVFVKPRKGNALLFWDLKPDGQTGDK